MLFLGLPCRKKRTNATAGSHEAVEPAKPLSLGIGSAASATGRAKEVMVTFFGYCALERTAGLWASSYLASNARGVAEAAAASHLPACTLPGHHRWGGSSERLH